MPEANSPVTISVIIAIRNEAAHIEACIASLFQQDSHSFTLEILAVDGMSNDGTREILSQLQKTDPRLRIVDNPDQRTPHAFNRGLAAARGSYIAILGAHTTYDRNYLATCLSELQRHEATGVSGRVKVLPASERGPDRLNAWVCSHPLGSSRQSFRTLPEGWCASLPYPLLKTQAVRDIGGYDERLLRNQDNDLNQRLIAGGGRLYLTWQTGCQYRFRRGLRGLSKYGWTNGRWNAYSLRVNWRSMRPHHIAPGMFVAIILIGVIISACGLTLNNQQLIIAGTLSFGSPLALHLILGTIAGAIESVHHKNIWALLFPIWLITLHGSYGLGLLHGALCGFKSPE